MEQIELIKILNTPIDFEEASSRFSKSTITRTANILKSWGLVTYKDVIEQGWKDILQTHSCGNNCIFCLEFLLDKHGLDWKTDIRAAKDFNEQSYFLNKSVEWLDNALKYWVPKENRVVFIQEYTAYMNSQDD